MRFFSERLRADHDLSRFSCGNEILDRWLQEHALDADRAGTGRTYVWIEEAGDVAAYFTLAPHLVRRLEMPPKQGRGSPDVIPSILLARLALRRDLHGSGLGGALLADALGVACSAIRQAGGRLIVVDAIDDAAAAFYRHHGFVPIPQNPFRLVMKASVGAKSLGPRLR